MLDSHCHLADQAFSDDLPEVVTRAQQAGVETALCILAAGDVDEEARAEVLRNLWPSVSFACGIHPHQANTWAGREADLAAYLRDVVTQQDDVVAIGEIGLDYHYNFSEPRDQKKVYLEQLEMASSLDLPAVVHCRQSDDDILSGIQQSGHSYGVIHCFTSGLDFANSILKAGFYISFTGIITFVKELEEVVKTIPLDKMMVETDSPYLSPKPHRGKKNEPAYVMHVAEKIANLKEISVEEVANATTETAYNLFAKLKN